MKTLRYAFWGIVALCLVLVGLANRDLVTLHAMPTALANLIGISPDIQLPLFVPIFGGVGIGLFIGFLWEWIREHKNRAEARTKGKEVQALRRELDRLKGPDGAGQDDIIALVDNNTR